MSFISAMLVCRFALSWRISPTKSETTFVPFVCRPSEPALPVVFSLPAAGPNRPSAVRFFSISPSNLACLSRSSLASLSILSNWSWRSSRAFSVLFRRWTADFSLSSALASLSCNPAWSASSSLSCASSCAARDAVTVNLRTSSCELSNVVSSDFT